MLRTQLTVTTDILQGVETTHAVWKNLLGTCFFFVGGFFK
jgi:hypothetical protein